MLSSASLAQHKNTINFTPSVGATGYNAYKAPASCTGVFVKVNTTPLPASATSFVDTSVLLDGDVNCYYITALNGTAESDPSTKALATTPTLTATVITRPPPPGNATSASQ